MRRHIDNPPLNRPGVYLLWDEAVNKGYVGIGQDLLVRVRNHEWGTSPLKLKRAIAKRGIASFVVLPLYYSLDGTEGLPAIEADLITEWKTYGIFGYNVLRASGRVGPYGEEFQKICREAHADEQYRAAASARALAYVATPEGRSQIDEAIRLSRTPEANRKRSAVKTRVAKTPEGRAALLAMGTKSKTPGALAKFTASRLIYEQSEEGRAARALLMIAAQTPAAKAKRAASMQAYRSRKD